MRRSYSLWRRVVPVLLVLGLLGAMTGVAAGSDDVRSSHGTTVGPATRVGGTPVQIAVPVVATSSVRFCSPYDENPSCADQTLAGNLLAGFRWSEDYVFGHSVLGWWGLLGFNIPGEVFGSTINWASLRLYPSFVDLQAYETEYRVTAFAEVWNPSTVTFNTVPSYYTSPSPAVSGSTMVADQPSYWDVTGIVENWADGSWQPYGLYLWDPNVSYPGYTSWRAIPFYGSGDPVSVSWKPTLIINYTPDVTYYCNGVEATIVGTSGNDSLVGTNGPDVIVGLDGNDAIFGKGGDDIICGGPGNDTILGKAGRDTLVGEAGHDTLKGGDDKDRLFGDDGKDTLYGEGHHDILRGGRNPDTIWAGPGNDRVFGAAGNDLLYGQRGNDLLYGHRGNDTLLGGPGTDLTDGGAHTDTCDGETEVNCEL